MGAKEANITSFKPGHTGGGRKKLPPELRAARAMSYEEMIRQVVKIRAMPLKEAKRILKDCQDTLTLGEIAIYRAYMGNKQGPDYRAIKYFEDRLYGKAVETIDIGIDLTPKVTESNVREVLNKIGIGCIDAEVEEIKEEGNG